MLSKQNSKDLEAIERIVNGIDPDWEDPEGAYDLPKPISGAAAIEAARLAKLKV